jgi:restriction system protein
MNPTPDQNDVSTALGLLRDSLSEEEQRIRNEGAKAMQSGDYDTATSVIEFAKRLLTFQKKVEGLVSEWDELEDLRDTATPAVQEIVSKRFFGKKKKGEITPHTDFYRPISSRRRLVQTRGIQPQMNAERRRWKKGIGWDEK